MSNESQSEEREVLLSIYEGDPNFKDMGPNVYQYKYGEENDSKSFLLEIKWGENYPDEIPIINLDLFFNRHLIPSVRSHIVDEITKEANNNIGFAMTFTLFEWVKEMHTELMSLQPDTLTEAVSKVTITEQEKQDNENVSTKTVKKENLSKAQKRKQWDRLEKGERPRGHDWVDVIKHLSQTGPKETPEPVSSSAN